MPPYELIQLKYVIFTFGIGIGLTIAIILARGSKIFSFTLKKRSEQDLLNETHEFGDGIQESNRPVPVFIWLVFIGYFIWATSYIIYSSIFGL